MKRLWYYFVRAYVSLGLNFYYKRIIIRNASNIPRDKAVIFAANHQNAFLDAIVLACTNTRYNHFLVRADIFKKGWAIRLLNSLNMMPAYRMRDGWQSLGKNQQTFDRCEEILGQKNTVVIFPEGNHGDQRRLRTLSKGFTRVAFESIKKNPQRKIFIVPVGLNYSDPQGFRGSLSVLYGEPILANDYFSADDPASATRLKDEVASRLKTLITHVDDETNYESIIKLLEASAPDYLDPVETNHRIAEIENGGTLAAQPKHKSKQTLLLFPLQIVSSILNSIPLALWARMRNKLKDPVFIGSMKFVFGILVFPIYYVLISLLVYLFAGPLVACGIFFLLVVSMLVRKA